MIPLLIEALLAASRDPASVIRLRAAYVLGIVGGPQAIDRLAEMLGDPYPDVAYNAATGLARHGDTRSIDELAAMLEVGEKSPAVASEEEDLRDEKRWAIVVNALRAVGQLAEANPKRRFEPRETGGASVAKVRRKRGVRSCRRAAAGSRSGARGRRGDSTARFGGTALTLICSPHVHLSHVRRR